MPKVKKKHWNSKLQSPFHLKVIPNHPEIKMNVLTPTIAKASKNVRVIQKVEKFVEKSNA